MEDLLFFDSQIERKFLTADAVYRFSCGTAECEFTYGVPHLMLIVRVRGLADDQVGIVSETAGAIIETLYDESSCASVDLSHDHSLGHYEEGT